MPFTSPATNPVTRPHTDERRVALVTGGAVRVGAAITRALVGAGYHVWLHHNRSTGAAAELAAEYPCDELGSAGILGTLAADLCSASARRAAAAVVTDPKGSAAGRLDLLVNNAASFERGSFAARTDTDLARVLELNLIAPLSLVRACLDALRATRGAVVNILDVAAFHPWPEHLDHCVAKAALKTATEALAVELAPVRVNAVAPGTVAWPTDPRFDEGSPARAAVERRIPLGQIGTPAEVARAVVFLAQPGHITGQTLVVDGGRLAGIAGSHG